MVRTYGGGRLEDGSASNGIARRANVSAGSIFVTKQVEEKYNVQLESHEPVYNVCGDLTTTWHHVSHAVHDACQSVCIEIWLKCKKERVVE